MTTVKIVSDPYKRNIGFETVNSKTGEWERVDYQNNPGSKLITEDIKSNFFPYKIREIVEIIQEEYLSEGETLQLVFEGTNDEFLELEEVCREIENIDCIKSSVCIENARDILPQIVSIFNEVQPIVENNISSETVRKEIERDIARFTDASNDLIPICVLGNYSSGKSTFINALIGMEILPSGDMPITAKIYRIMQSYETDSASISLFFNGNRIDISISASDFEITDDGETALSENISKALQNASNLSLAEKANQCLEIINKQRDGVSDLIDIKIPFESGPLRDSKNSFVVFDTPGSNTATHKDHFSILEGAMKNLSNGIPIYVAEYNSLDSCDNESLYENIKSISQIDSRFTMIVVNKADSANIKASEFDGTMEEMILQQAVPRNLYSGGIYFVSSIMGLGSKNNGSFIDEHMEEFFEDNERKYSDETSKRYKTLYRFNIMPEQIKRSIIEDSESANNKIFANSGLFAVEHEIVNFAEKYAAYDKCMQSDKYIEKIISATQEEIQSTKKVREERKKALEDELAEDKRVLINSMGYKSHDLTEHYKDAYNESLNECHKSVQFSYTNDAMKSLEQEILAQNRVEHNYSEKVDGVKEARDAIIDNFADLGKKTILDIVRDVGDDIRDTIENAQELRETKIKTDKETADELINAITDDFNERADRAVRTVASASRKYWEQNADKIKGELLSIVADSNTLDDDKKGELAEIITSYETVKFKDDQEFEKADFEMKIHFLWMEIDLNRINTKKLTEKYNKDFKEKIGSAMGEIKKKHGSSFDGWCERLINKIRTNIVDYSPKLSEQAKEIEKETQKIEQLEETETTLHHYSEQIEALMDWKVLM